MVGDLLKEAKGLYENGKYDDARQKLEDIRFNYPGNAFIGEVQFYIGLCYFRLKDYLTAEQEFRTVTREFSRDHEFGDDALYYLCAALFQQARPARLDQGLTRRAVDEIDLFSDTYPKSPFSDSVAAIRRQCTDRLAEKEFLSGRLYRRMGYTSAAIVYFQSLERDYPGSKWSVRGRYEWALSSYQQKKYDEALKNADTCRIKITRLEEAEAGRLNTPRTQTFFSRLVHLFGLIPHDPRSDLRIFVDEIKSDLSALSQKIEKKKR
jgi:outer membrane protein assembly factor BamD (BamD/ComL family)